jgi:hypothetical protein
MKNKIIYNSTQTDRINPIKIELVYTDQKEVAAVHLFTKKGLFSYNRSGMDFTPAGDSAFWDASWFGNYE